MLASQIEEIAGVDLGGFSEVEDSTWERKFMEAAAVGERSGQTIRYLPGDRWMPEAQDARSHGVPATVAAPR
jgi:hypothetical protein